LGYSASGFAYEPEFITPAEEHALLATIATLAFTNAHYKEYTAKRRIVVYDSEIPEYLRPARGQLGIELEPRSAYVMRNDVRWQWQHSIAPTRALRYSITFRTLLAP